MHTDPIEGYTVGMLIPAPALKHTDFPRWYEVTGCINSGTGNISYTLEPACNDQSLPAIKLFRSTASDPYAWDSKASIKNDLNPINPVGYEGNLRVIPYEKDFFNSRTIPLWVGYVHLAERELEKAGDTASIEHLKECWNLLKQANNALLTDSLATNRMYSFSDLFREYDYLVLALMGECTKEGALADAAKIVNLIKKYTFNNPITPNYQEQIEDALELINVLSNHTMTPERADYYLLLKNHVIDQSSLSHLLQNRQKDFYNKVMDPIDNFESKIKKLFNKPDIDQKKIILMLERWTHFLQDLAFEKKESMEQKKPQDLECIGHSLGGGLAQRYFAHYTLLSNRIPLPGQQFQLYAFDAPGIRNDEAKNFIVSGLKHSDILEKFNYPIKINLRFESGDPFSLGGQRHLGSTESKSEANEVRDWLRFDAAVQSSNKVTIKEINDSLFVHGSQFEAGQRKGFKTMKDKILSNLVANAHPEDKEEAMDFVRTWYDTYSQGLFDKRGTKKEWEMINELWNIDSLFTHWHIETFRVFVSLLVRSEFFVSLDKEQKKDPSLFGNWKKYADQNGVFAIDSTKGIISAN